MSFSEQSESQTASSGSNSHSGEHGGGHGSDFQVNPQWWQASDLRWYPPELHPDYVAEPKLVTAPSDSEPNLVTAPTNGDPADVGSRYGAGVAPGSVDVGSAGSARGAVGSAGVAPGTIEVKSWPVEQTQSKRSQTPQMPPQPGINRPVGTAFGAPTNLGENSWSVKLPSSTDSRNREISRPIIASTLAGVAGIGMTAISFLEWGSGTVNNAQGAQVGAFNVAAFESNGEFTLAIGALLMIVSGLGFMGVLGANLTRWFSLSLGVIALAISIFTAVDLAKLSQRMTSQWVQDPLFNAGDQITANVGWPVWALMVFAAIAVVAAWFDRG